MDTAGQPTIVRLESTSQEAMNPLYSCDNRNLRYNFMGISNNLCGKTYATLVNILSSIFYNLYYSSQSFVLGSLPFQNHMHTG